MARGETETIAVCAATSGSLESLVEIVREAGPWDIVPIQWPDAKPVLDVARRTANALLLHSGEAAAERPCDELIEMLAARPEHKPLIVVGLEPARRATPTLWLPTMPSAPLLAPLIDQLL